MTAMTEGKLKHENSRYHGTGGVSSESRRVGLRPAFKDTATQAIYLSRFAGGALAPFHCLEGLPDELVLGRTTSGRVAAIKPSVMSGFARGDLFYSRDEAAALGGIYHSFD